MDLAMERTRLINLFKDYVHDNIIKSKNTKLDDHIRISTFNVHLWKNYDGKENYANIIKTIGEIDADIIGLQEALFFSKQSKDIFIKNMMDLGYAHIKICNPTYCINVIASKYPIKNTKIISLIKDPIKKQSRYCIICEIIIQQKIITVTCTHLDVYDDTENTRFEQIKQITSYLNKKENVVLIGDLNSVNPKDYTNEEWDNIVKNDSNRDVETQTKVTDHLKKCIYIDCFELSKCSRPSVTTWSMRRVDYILCSAKNNFAVNGCFIVPTLCSDHFPIVAEILI